MPSVRGIPRSISLFFYGFHGNEPEHVHVQRERMTCKFWLRPVVLASNSGFARSESEDTVTAHLLDGRTISVPLVWSWRLNGATTEQRQNDQIIAGVDGVRWPDVDEDISVRGMLHGVPARPPKLQSQAPRR